MMSVGKKTTQYTVAAVVIAAAIIGASFIYLGIPSAFTSSSTSTSGSAVGGPTSTLLIQLTDPPHVPQGTTSLNLTYSQIGILAAEPTATPGKVNATTIPITPAGGNATVDLLKLQNLSQTLASASLPNDSVIYSVSFAVSNMTIDVNGTVSPVTLVSGGPSLTVTIANPSRITGTNVALLQLNPVVVDTPNGYQMIPSAVGVIQHNHGQGESEVGSQHKLTQEDFGNLSRAAGNATVNLVTLQVSGNQTTLTVQVNNTGTIPLAIIGIGVHGNFTMSPPPCQSTSSGNNNGNFGTSGSNGDSNHSQGDGFASVSPQDSGSSGSGPSGIPECAGFDHPTQVVFVPSAMGTVGANGCVQGNMSLANGDVPEGQARNSTISPGECVDLTFSGVLSFGHSQLVLIPSTLTGQTYGLSLIASNGANQQISCVLSSGTTSCAPVAPQRSGDN